MDFELLKEKAAECEIKVGFFSKNLYKYAASIVTEGEDLLTVAEGLDSNTASKVPIIVTNKNVYIVKFASAFGGFSQTVIPLERIGSVSIGNGMFLKSVIITDGAVQQIVDSIAFTQADVLIKTINEAKTSNSNQNNYVENSVENKVNLSDQIKELKKLVDDGLITQDEFDMKKKQILGL
ncbi:MAG: SHOCT domain-containing protein [Spirochaetales bacterium]|nr:SHOCT domain-containing protein [Spirochaetales bacterium]